MIFYGLSRMSAKAAEKQSTAAAIGGAVGIAIAGALLWGVIALLAHVQLSLIGVLIGAGVGAVVHRYRAGHVPTIVAGAVIAVAGCALGTLAGMVFALMNAHIPLSVIFSHFNVVMHEYPHDVGPLGVLFWAIAAFAAVRVPMQSQRVAARGASMQPPAPTGTFGQSLPPKSAAAPSPAPFFSPPPADDAQQSDNS